MHQSASNRVDWFTLKVTTWKVPRIYGYESPVVIIDILVPGDASCDSVSDGYYLFALMRPILHVSVHLQLLRMCKCLYG